MDYAFTNFIHVLLAIVAVGFNASYSGSSSAMRSSVR